MTDELHRTSAPTQRGSRFFRHRPEPPPGPVEVVLNDTTRLMCAGAYINPTYARRMIQELIENEHRAVAPSAGYDLDAVLRHCFHARRLDVRRNAVLTLLLAASLVITPFAATVWLAAVAGLLAGALVRLVTRRPAVVTGAGVVVAVLFLCASSGLTSAVLDALPYAVTRYYYRYSDGGSASVTTILVWIALLLGAALAVQTTFRYRLYQLLTGDLAHGVRRRLPDPPPGRAGARLRVVAAAQWGNMVLQAHRDPFLGAGVEVETWSMCLRMTSRTRPGEPVDIDPVQMHAAVRARLESMGQAPLRERERLSGLTIRDYVVATGDRRRDDPLIDPVTSRPWSDASPEAITAIIRHPQGSLRYYQRAILGTEGKDIVSEPGQVVAPAQDQEIAVSTFLYLAVEGGMLYAEFVAKVAPPILASFHLFDRVAPDGVLARAFRDVVLRVPRALALAPYRLALGVIAGGYTRRMDQNARRHRAAYVSDYGARTSARNLASATGLDNYLQVLDGEKYYKVAERAITEALLEYLRANDVDTAEFEARITTVHNNGVIISGGTVSGPVAAGRHATATV